ncbi:MAG: hypothetical protein N2487_00810 [Verrucomicrobiae bacterium]|nr:hypothetical protein [Verrucomicrobiae bacterium]
MIKFYQVNSMPSSDVVILTAEQVRELNNKLSTMRHNVNNYLSLIVAASEVLKINPSSLPRMLPTFKEQPDRIINEIRIFSDELEKALGLKK